MNLENYIISVTRGSKMEDAKRKLDRFLFGMNDTIALKQMIGQLMLYDEPRTYLWQCVEEYDKAFSFPIDVRANTQ